MMIKVVSLLLLEELSEVGILSFDSLLGVQVLNQLIGREVPAVENLAGLPALLLCDVACVRVSEEEDA